jgi:hypothetical protein
LKFRLKVYLILAFISLILLFYSIWQIKPVIVEPTALLGLASYLTPAYWIGLALILLCSILAFLDRKLKSDALFLFILVVLGLFLFGITVFSQEYPRGFGSYYPSAEAKNVIETGYIDVGAPHPSYNSWPATQLTAASILQVTGIDLLPFIQYFPLFWVLCFILTTYSIGKRLKLPSNLPFLLSFFALSSYWLLWSNYTPQSVAILLYLLCFMFIIFPRDTFAERVLAILTFGALLLWHALAPLAVLLGLLAVSLYRRETKFIALLFVLFGAWYVFQAFSIFEMGVTGWWSDPLLHIFEMTQQVERVGVAAPPGRFILRYSQLFYPAVYFIIIMAAIVLLLRRRVNKEHRQLIISCLFWGAAIFGLVLIPAVPGMVDIIARLYLYGLGAAVCIMLLILRNRKLLVTLMILFVALHMPAHYGVEAAWAQVPATELKGARFFALQVKPQEPYFYDDGNGLNMVYFYDPDLINVPYFMRWHFADPEKVDPTVLNKATYIVIGRLGSDRMVWAYGEDPLRDWLQTEGRKELNLLYNNGGYQIYENTTAQR